MFGALDVDEDHEATQQPKYEVKKPVQKKTQVPKETGN